MMGKSGMCFAVVRSNTYKINVIKNQ
uniref:Uncharacterized protein n=1 Tax=Anguilla anguilla TaxID=7936 RepID=A0A0E9THL5_ANGAN